MSSSINKFIGSRGTAQSTAEESGWTQYFDDFSSDQKEHDSSSYSNGSPSLVSDAASPNKKESGPCSAFSDQQVPRRLNVKEKRTKKYSCDDLEDTASSPVNSPKVSSLKPMDSTYRRTDESIGNFRGKETRPVALHQSDERSSINFDGKNNGYVELKKKGLCLMPFSMVLHYLG
ncbi:vascular-related unknown protein 1-like [Coffea arabica]|uniref:Uncharacterized protein n=1 Tax=Coffea arabica TaxID=13443 RepID=A0A6P6XH10_COFAR|nr:vascular-related unknown protein 1-like [Coffea arabica]